MVPTRAHPGMSLLTAVASFLAVAPGACTKVVVLSVRGGTLTGVALPVRDLPRFSSVPTLHSPLPLFLGAPSS